MSASDDVWHAVDEITRPNKKRLIRDDGTVIWVEEPSLWDRLEEALATGSEQGGTAGVPESKPPLDMDVVEWRRNVYDVVCDALVGHEKAMRDTVPESLRLLASTVISTTDADLIEEWRRTFRRWAHQARTKLGVTILPRAIWGASCPSCQATHAQVDTPDGKVRRPTLSLVFNEHLIRHAECLSCSKTWFRGDQLIALAALIPGTPASDGDVDPPIAILD